MTRYLFVCLGNICRSPAAEGVASAMREQNGLEIEIDSAGTSGYHQGERADARMRRAAAQRGFDLTSRSRQVVASDFDDFDHIVAMDRSNLADLQEMAPPDCRASIRLFSEFCDDRWPTDVPDPYYGGDDGFDYVLDMLEDGMEKLL